MEALKTLQQASLCYIIVAPLSPALSLPLFVAPLVSLSAVVQLHSHHRQEGEGPAGAGGADALRRGQGGASGGHRFAQPGHGQEEQGADWCRLTFHCKPLGAPERHHQVCSCCTCPWRFYSGGLSLGGYALRDLVGNLPCGQQHPARNLEGDTVVSILNTIHEVITDNPENARALIQGHGVQKLVAIHKSR